MTDRIELGFSAKYDRRQAQAYLEKHRAGHWRQMSHRRDLALAREALKIAGEPGLVLDLPCGAGRFWPLLAEKANRTIIAADRSEHMLSTALANQPEEVVRRVKALQTSAFDIELPENAVDSIFCMRLLHHVADPAHRMAMLREFHRVTRDTVIVSLWVSGNYKAWRRERLEQRRLDAGKDPQNRFVQPASVLESEFAAAGFEVVRHLDFLPLYSMWRVYVLRKVRA